MDKKEKIVQAAIEVFREKGIEKTKISDIVKLAGIAQGTFYLYFPSKLSVMPAIAEVMVERMITFVQDQADANESFEIRLSQIVDAIFAYTNEYREILALIYAGLASSDHIRQWETVYEPFYAWISDFLNEAKGAGLVRASLHVENTSKLFIGLVESAAEQIYLYDHTDEKQAAIQKKEVLEFLQYGLGYK
ncbi:TetR family transcriptional regulator [Cytobacillus horneckiae]|uniref:TetR family transcriptional regulator n=1 Tax=Cytobacillus horneckiae TaxID=549687 RepID=UPI003D9A8872